MSTKRPAPIIILGCNRNGTTWLGNLISTNFSAVTASHQLHFGIFETTFYAYKKYFGKLKSNEDYIRFLEVFSASDFFLLLEGDKAFFYKNKILDFYDFAFELFDQYAIKHQSKYWTTKLDTDFFSDEKEFNFFLEKLKKRYPEYHFISIKRAYDDYVKSSSKLKAYSWKFRNTFLAKPISIIISSCIYYYNYNYIDKFAKSNKVLQIKFADLKANTAAELQRVKQYLNYDKPVVVQASEYVKNSSFKQNEKKQVSKFWVPFCKLLFGTNPFFHTLFMKGLAFLQGLLPPRNPLYFRLMEMKFFKEEFVARIAASHDAKILEEIKNSKAAQS